MEPPLDLNEFLVRNKTATFFFRVSGDSVNEEGIFDGDLLVADRSIRAKHDHLVVASVDGDFTVKKLYHRGSVVELRPANPAYQPIRFSEGQEVLVWGVVRGVARALAV